MWIRQIFLGIFGAAAGGAVAGAVFAFIVTIGVVQRLAQKTKTAKKILLYEDSVLLGGIFGAVLTLFQIPLNQYLFGTGTILLLIFGLFSGIYVGCLAISLVEALNSIAVLARRIHMDHGIRWILGSIALGKMLGSLLYFYKRW